MKFGMRKPRIKKSIATRTRGKAAFGIWDLFKQRRVRPGDLPFSGNSLDLTVTPSAAVTFKTKRGRRDNPDALTKQSI